MPCMASRMHLVPPPDSTDPWALDARPSHILDTIKVPKNLGMRKLALDLPVRRQTRVSCPARVLCPASPTWCRASAMTRSTGGHVWCVPRWVDTCGVPVDVLTSVACLSMC
jgi:hypothetical protein